jgi:hypothetical protein
MAVYYMLFDADLFSRRLCPALAASWRRRSFEPCRTLCSDLVPAALALMKEFATSAEEPLICKAARDLAFDRDFWHLLVGELLFYSAAEIPEIQVAPETFCCLLSPESYRQDALPRARFAPIQQAHFGKRELLFSTRCYRPEYAGYNDPGDVAALTAYLARQAPEKWTVADLRELRNVATDEERADELDFAREWFPALRELYERASANGQVIVCEIL